MADLLDDDKFLVNEAATGTTKTIQKDELMAQLEDGDLMLLNRTVGGTPTTYTITGEDLKDSLDSGAGAIVTAPSIVASSEYSPSTLTATAAVVTNATKDTSYDNWYKDDVAIAGTAEQLVYTATSPGDYKYEERWVGNDAAELKPKAEATVKQSTVAKPTVIAPEDGAGQSDDVGYYPKTSAIKADGIDTFDYPETDVITNTSTDSGSNGSSWSNCAITNPSFYNNNDRFTTGAYGKGRYVMGGATANQSYNILTSGDGSTFSPHPVNYRFNDIKFAQNKFVGGCSGEGNSTPGFIAYSEDGTTWQKATVDYSNAGGSIGSNGTFVNIAYGNGVWVAQITQSATEQKIFLSTDGENFTAATNGLKKITAVTSGLIYAENQFVIEITEAADNENGYNQGVIYTSPDGDTWTRRANLDSPSPRGVAYTNGVYVACSYGGKFAYSTDKAVTWTTFNISVMTATGFQDICASNGQFACSNEKGTVVVSTNGIGWNQYQVLGSVPPYTRHINVLNDRFILSLDNGLSFKYSKITVNKVTFQTDKDLDKFNTGDLILKSPETRVLSVQANDSPPTMYVSSQEWSNGETIKNYTPAGAYDVKLTFTDDKAYSESDNSEKTTIDQAFKAGTKVVGEGTPDYTDIIGKQTDAFKTYTYTGNNTNGRALPLGIDNSSESLVWIKNTSTDSTPHALFTQSYGLGEVSGKPDQWGGLDCSANSSLALLGNSCNGITEFNSSGVSVNNNGSVNGGSSSYVAWNFRSSPGFFDVVRYKGDQQSARAIPHNLGSAPGFIIVKQIDRDENWMTYHISSSQANWAQLDKSDAQNSDPGGSIWGGIPPTADNFYVGNSSNTNHNEGEFVAYVFGNTPGKIKCEFWDAVAGSGTRTVDCGFEPQWVMIKKIHSNFNGVAEDWLIFDAERGMLNNGANQPNLAANKQNKNASSFKFWATSNGFATDEAVFDSEGSTFIYIAIAKDVEAGQIISSKEAFSSTQYTGTSTGTGSGVKQIVNTGIDNTVKSMLWFKNTDRSTDHAIFDTERTPPDYRWLRSNKHDGELDGAVVLENRTTTGFTAIHASSGSGTGTINPNNSEKMTVWNFKAAPNFFDIVKYKGTQTENVIEHNLGSAPGAIIAKCFNKGNAWGVWFSSLPGEQMYLDSNSNSGASTGTPTDVTSTSFTVGNNVWFNETDSNDNMVAYLFGNSAGSSKVDQYNVGDGTAFPYTINTGFRVGWLLIKCSSHTGCDWMIFDRKHGTIPLLANEDSSLTTVGDYSGNFAWSDTDGFILKAANNQISASFRNYEYIAIADDAEPDYPQPTGVLTEDADKAGPSMTLKDVTGIWTKGLSAVGETELTDAAPDPELLEFVGSVPAVDKGTIANGDWTNATWTVTPDGGAAMVDTVAITPGTQQKLKVADATNITLEDGTTYDVKVKYEATDAVAAESDANTFKTSGSGNVGAIGNFNAILYTGSTDTDANGFINTGVDNTGKALVWTKTKDRSSGDIYSDNVLADTVVTDPGCLITNKDGPLSTTPNDKYQFNSYGFKPSSQKQNPEVYACWNFAAAEKFFDIVAWDGNDTAGREIEHSLGVEPGCIIIKSTSSTSNWSVIHKNLKRFSTNYWQNVIWMNLRNQENSVGSTILNNTRPTDKVFTVNDSTDANGGGRKYVAYLFADSPDDGIKCGAYSGTAEFGPRLQIDCGFKPAWVLIKCQTTDANWIIVDKNRKNQNGAGQAAAWLHPNNSNKEYDDGGNDLVKLEANGFSLGTGGISATNLLGEDYIYIAIADDDVFRFYYDENSNQAVTGQSIIKQYGVEPDSAAARTLGFAELTEQPTYGVSGYELQDSGRYKPIRSYESAYNSVTDTLETIEDKLATALAQVAAFDSTEDGPFAIDGYYPLYKTTAAADAASDAGTHHEHTINGVEYYMPDGGTIYHGDYDSDASESGDSGDSSSDSGDSSY